MHCTPCSNPEAPFSIFGRCKEAYPSQQYGLMKVKHPEKFLVLLITKSVKRTHSHCRLSPSPVPK